MRNVTQIIDAAGGVAAVAEAVGLSDGVRKWTTIPEQHWLVMIDLVPRLTPSELHRANVDARAEGAQQ